MTRAAWESPPNSAFSGPALMLLHRNRHEHENLFNAKRVPSVPFKMSLRFRRRCHSAAIALQKSIGEKRAQNRRQIFGNVLGDEAGPKMTGGGAMQPDGGGGGFEGRHGWGKKAARDPSQYISRTRRGEPWRQILGYCRQALRIRDHRIGGFQNQHRAAQR